MQQVALPSQSIDTHDVPCRGLSGFISTVPSDHMRYRTPPDALSPIKTSDTARRGSGLSALAIEKIDVRNVKAKAVKQIVAAKGINRFICI